MSRESDPLEVTDALEAAIDAFNEEGYGIPTREAGIDSDAEWTRWGSATPYERIG